MKKSIFLFFAAILCAMSMQAGPSFGGGYIYFHNKGNWSDNSKQLCIGRDQWENDWTETRIMTVVKNTQLWTNALPTSGWGDATYMGVIGNASDWGSEKWGSGNLKNANHRTAAVALGDWGFNNNSCQMLIPASGNNDASLSLTWIGSSVDAMNKTITVKAKTSNDGKTYTVASSPGTLSASSFKFSDYKTCGTATSLSANKITCGYTATTKLTAQTNVSGYVFMGWYDKDGNLQTENATLTIYPTADADYYAYYKKPLTYTVTVPVGTEECYIAGDMNGWGFTKMTNKGNNVFTITLDKATATQGYKYTCGNDWKYVEVKTDGNAINNRTYTTSDNVVKWAAAPGLHLVGDMNDWNVFAGELEGTTTASLTLKLEAGNYGFKITSNGEWLGNDGQMERGGMSVEEGGWDFTNNGNNCTLVADVAGYYVFTWYTNQKKLTVKYPNIYTISATAENGTVDGVGEYVEGETVTLTAKADPGYQFASWSDNSTANPYTFTATKDITLTAYFQTKTVQITEGNNSTVLKENNGQTVNVEVIRHFMAGNLYTIALPFTLNDVASVFGVGTKVYEYISLVEVGGEVVLNFNIVNSIESGKPYLIAPTKEVSVFKEESVTLSNATNNISFTIGKTTIAMEAILSVTSGEKTGSKYWLAADKYLYNSSNDLPALRALFNVSTTSGMPPRARVALGENAATGVDNITNTDNTTTKVIENGQLIIIRNGEKFNAQGVRL